MSAQGTLWGGVRSTDPQTSRDAAERCGAASQRATILRQLLGMEGATAEGAWVTADFLARRFGGHRSIWSTRLAGMASTAHGHVPLLAKGAPETTRSPDTGQPRKVLTFHLTDAGREAARALGGGR